MAHQPIEDLLPKSGYSIYKLVRMASQRAKELADGKHKLVPAAAEEKTATIALDEIRAGMVVLKEVEHLFGPPPGAKKTKNAKPDVATEEMAAS